jgi:hypothetical protein
MDDRELSRWVFDNGGPAIRYRTATELLSDSSIDVGKLAGKLIESPLVTEWLERLGPPLQPEALRNLRESVRRHLMMDQIHSSRNTAYENVMGKLVQLGCRAGMPAFDAKTAPWRSWLEDATERAAEPPFGLFRQRIVASFLMMAGYHDEAAVSRHVRGLLETVADLARQRDYDIYIDQDTYPGYPKSFRPKPLINPELYPDGEMRLPSIHDINAFAHLPEDGRDAATQEKIDTVVAYILDDRFQRLPPGYGVIYQGQRRFYAAGWGVKLPGYFGFGAADVGAADFDASQFVQRLELMAHFPTARGDRWLTESLAHLEGFRTGRGTYLFPAPFLQEKKQAYWVTGGYMGFEEGKRSAKARELESTFWMLKIRKLAEQGD